MVTNIVLRVMGNSNRTKYLSGDDGRSLLGSDYDRIKSRVENMFGGFVDSNSFYVVLVSCFDGIVGHNLSISSLCNYFLRSRSFFVNVCFEDSRWMTGRVLNWNTFCRMLLFFRTL